MYVNVTHASYDEILKAVLINDNERELIRLLILNSEFNGGDFIPLCFKFVETKLIIKD